MPFGRSEKIVRSSYKFHPWWYHSYKQYVRTLFKHVWNWLPYCFICIWHFYNEVLLHLALLHGNSITKRILSNNIVVCLCDSVNIKLVQLKKTKTHKSNVNVIYFYLHIFSCPNSLRFPSILIYKNIIHCKILFWRQKQPLYHQLDFEGTWFHCSDIHSTPWLKWYSSDHNKQIEISVPSKVFSYTSCRSQWRKPCLWNTSDYLRTTRPILGLFYPSKYISTVDSDYGHAIHKFWHSLSNQTCCLHVVDVSTNKKRIDCL